MDRRSIEMGDIAIQPLAKLAAAVVLFAIGISGVPLVLGAPPTPAERGYRLLTTKPYLPPDFDQQTFDQVWQVWPAPLRSAAAEATPDERRQMAFERYGLTQRPGVDSGKPLQYVVDDDGNWTMNCFACHGGHVLNAVVPGRPNSDYALQTLTEEIRATKLQLGKQLTRMDVGSLFMPLGKTNGTTNAVMFGVALMAYRDADLNVYPNNPPPKNMVHHDMDAPPWWHFKKRSHIYIDGFAPKNARGLMQFMLVRENGPEKFHEWEADFQDVFAYLESVQPPDYPFAVAVELARQGKATFLDNCARCHGTYGKHDSYPAKTIPIQQIGTDPVRLGALSVAHREGYAQSWFAGGQSAAVVTDPAGYVAPPLDGVWASAPYFHNGSVPTLWHVLHPSERPVVWTRVGDGFDEQRIGLAVEAMEQVPTTIRTALEMRRYFNTQAFGKSAAGHLYPDELTESEKRAVLEYLKTL